MNNLTIQTRGDMFPQSVADDVAHDPGVAPRVDGVQAGLELVGSAADLTQRQGESGVRLIAFDPATQRPFGRFLLTDGRSTSGDDMGQGVLLSRKLGGALHARPGDRLRLSVEVGGVSKAGSFTV